MNRITGILITFLIAFAANAEMVRFVRAADGQTIVIDRNGMQVAVTLSGVSVAPEDQLAARTFLEHELTGAWLMVDNGNVYRSPDAFFVNGAMQKRGYIDRRNLRETYLGEGDFEPRKSSATAPPSRSESRTYRHTNRRSSATHRRGSR